MILKLLTNSLGLEVDQSKFLLSQVISLIIGIIFRYSIKASLENSFKRHVIETSIGLYLGYFCFEKDFFHLVFVALISLILMKCSPQKYVHIIVFVFTMAYLSYVHLYFQINSYGQKKFDITSPMMIFVQKLTYLAFSYSDGSKSIETLNEYQNQNSLKYLIKNNKKKRYYDSIFLNRELPTLLEYFSYLFHFQGVIVGPACNFKDYIEFIDGTNFTKYQTNSKISNNQPSVQKTLIKKLTCVIIMAILFFKITLQYPFKTLLEPVIISSPLWYRIFYLHIACEGQRLYYYLPWTLGDLVNNASGFGFNGYDENGEPKWDLLTNIDILAIETSTNIKCFIDNWHIQSSRWLRRVLFERLPKGKTLGVFLISSLWHGFYPGYYFSFVFSAFVIYTGRAVRRNIRPFFVNNKYSSILYSIIGWIISQIMIAYIVGPFFLLSFESSVKFYNSMNWSGHLLIFFLMIVLPKHSFKSKSS